MSKPRCHCPSLPLRFRTPIVISRLLIWTLSDRGAYRPLLGLLLQILHGFAHGISPRTTRFLLQKHL
jgi:hypothetical protein